MDFLEAQMSDACLRSLRELVRLAARPGMMALEVGSWAGGSSVAIGEVVKEFGGTLYCVDWWRGNVSVPELASVAREGNVFDVFERNVRARGLGDVVLPLKMPSSAAAKILRPGTFDFVFIDAEHTYTGVKNDIEAYLPFVRPGGVFSGHDCDMRLEHCDRAFLEAHKHEDCVAGLHCGVILAVGERFKNYRVRNTIWCLRPDGSPLDPSGPMDDVDESPAILVESDVAGHNIVRYRGAFYGVRQGEVDGDFARVVSAPASPATDTTSLVMGRSPSEVRARILEGGAMKIEHDRPYAAPPAVTFVLLDWDCRESYHFLDYLAEQSAPRDSYEVMSIEFYDKRPRELHERIARARETGKPDPIDRWVVLDVPRTSYYHKHLMYNVGIALARGRIVCNLDSDAMARPTFVQSIVDAFDRHPALVLHLDELRGADRGHYPFNHPSFGEVERGLTINGRDGRPAGLLERRDPVHVLNYGACMAATKRDLVAAGGADMHLDYLGYICGPYDLTYRLVNAGCDLVWHPTEWLYHTWHPGEAGVDNWAGPHDGMHMAKKTIETRRNGRVRPLVEHPVIERMRLGDPIGDARAVLDAFRETTPTAEWARSRLRKIGT